MTVLAVIGALAAGALAALAIQRVRFAALARAAAADAGDGAGSGGSRSPTDVAERLLRRSRQAEAALGEASSALQQLRGGIDELPVGVVLCDPDGNEIVRNRRAVELAGAGLGEALVAKAVDELLAEARSGRAGSRQVELTQSRHAYAVSAVPLLAASGGSSADGGSGVDTGGRGELLGAVALVRDVTEELRVERVRRDFVANVSHELKTPIGALALLTEALTAKVQAPDADPEASLLAERIHNQVERVTRTIDDLMMLSYIEDGTDHLDETADLAAAAAGAIERISEAADQHGVQVMPPEATAASALVRGSTVQLESALFNLLDNAVKFSKPGDAVIVSVNCEPDRVGVSVADHGIGIPEPEHDRIFERFYRVDSARSRDSGGTGLGLSVVRHVVINHGGDLRVSSREGAGSVFTLSFPRADPPDTGGGRQ